MRRRGKDGEKENPEPMDEERSSSNRSPRPVSILVLLRPFPSSLSLNRRRKPLNMSFSTVGEHGRDQYERRSFSGGISRYSWVVTQRIAIRKAG